MWGMGPCPLPLTAHHEDARMTTAIHLTQVRSACAPGTVTHSSLRPHAADATQERGGELLDAGTARTRRRAVADDAWGDSQAVVADPSPGHARPRGAGPMRPTVMMAATVR